MKRTDPNAAVLYHMLFVVEVKGEFVLYSYPVRRCSSWLHFEQFLREKLNYDQMKVSYKDEECDDINIGSEEEFQEVLKIYERSNLVLKLNVQRMETDVRQEQPIVDEEGFPAPVAKPPLFQMWQGRRLETLSSKSVEVDAKKDVNISPIDNVHDETTPPLWFTEYMEMFKDDVTAEAARKMMHRMQKFLVKEGVAFQQKDKLESAVAFQSQKRPVSPSNHVSSSNINKVVHTGIKCDNCYQTVVGVRYKCGNCEKFDLCEVCEALPDVHDKYHVFVKILYSARYAGFKPKTRKMVPLLKHLLYDDAVKAADLRTDREKKLLKRLDKQTHKLEKYRSKHSHCRHSEREGHGESRSNHLSNGHKHGSGQQHFHGSHSHQLQKNPIFVSSHACDHQTRSDEALCNTISKFNAEFVCDETIPDGLKLYRGTSFVKTWRLKNTGSAKWPNGTVLKCLWTSIGFYPDAECVAAPQLLPGDEGTISVKFTIPYENARWRTDVVCESHWCLYYQNERFGHQIWCKIEALNNLCFDVASREEQLEHVKRTVKVANKVDANKVVDGIEVQEPENGEKEPKVKDRKSKSSIRLGHTSWKFRQSAHGKDSKLQNQAEDKMLQPGYKSITSTPNNTPRDLTPPKSPVNQDAELNLFSELAMALDGDNDNTSLSNDAASDFGGSLVSLSSTDSDMGYVVVPMPACFNLTVPAVAVHGAPSIDILPIDKQSEREENSSVTPASDSDDETAKIPVAKVFRAPDDMNDSDSQDDMNDDASGATLEISALASKQVEDDPKVVEAESGEDVAAYDFKKLEANIPPIESDKVTSPPPHYIKKEEPAAANRRAPSSASDRMTILPEPIMSAAATVFNSARDILHNFTESTASRPTAPVVVSPLQQLQDMGFCNRELNEKLLNKNNFDIHETVLELLSLNDNEWYKNRH